MESISYFDDITGEYLGSPYSSLLESSNVEKADLKRNLSKYIPSISGWRAIIAKSNDEEDDSYLVSDEDLVLSSLFALSFYRYIGENSKIVVGRDARPTGRLLGEAVLRTLLAFGADVSYIATSAAPEIMAYSNYGFDGFFYISASHNPIGHNGYKFGKNGGVFGEKDAECVKFNLFDLLEDDELIKKLIKILSSPLAEEEAVLIRHKNNKENALSCYEKFVLETAGGDFRLDKKIGVVVDFNGSARARSIDIPFLRSHGIDVFAINDQPGQVVHGIVPECGNLELCRTVLEGLNKKEPHFILGYVPDNDGDCGNLVYYSKKDKKAKLLGAQSVFALVVLIDLAEDALLRKKSAVAANGCTSLLINEIAKKLGADVFHSDVGEANVVSLASALRKAGYSVKAAGEGSNGGVIEYPAKVRDPMNTIMTILKLYYNDALLSKVKEVLGINESDISSIIEALPEYITTSSFSKEGVLHAEVVDYDLFKKNYETNFSKHYRELFDECAFTGYKVFQYEGDEETSGEGEECRVKNSTGGYRVELEKDGKSVAFLWFSKSRTESLLRLMVDVKGNDEALYHKLLDWQHELVLKSL